MNHTCPRCQVEKPIEQFHKSGKKRGFSTYCRPCTADMQREYHARVRAAAGKTAPPEEKTCNRCGETKPATEFCKKSNHPDGLHHTCRSCMSARKRFARYGVTMEWFDQKLAEQDGRCAICPAEITESTCHVDHDHQTGAPRDLLCPNCNYGLGNFKDSPELLELAAAYLRRHAGVPVA